MNEFYLIMENSESAGCCLYLLIMALRKCIWIEVTLRKGLEVTNVCYGYIASQIGVLFVIIMNYGLHVFYSVTTILKIAR